MSNALKTWTAQEQVNAEDLNSNFALAVVLPGIVRMYAGSSTPDGYLLCDGSAVSRVTYSGLYAVIGTTYGSGDGSTTFNLPNFGGRSPMGVGANSLTLDFAAASVNASTNEITVPSNNSLYTGTKVRFTTTGGLPAPLALATDYYVIRVSATVIKLATSRQNALGSSTTTGASSTPVPIDITTQGTGTHTLTVQGLSTRTLGERGGEETHTQTIEELVAHSHVQLANAGNSSGSGGSPEDDPNPTGSTGGSTPFNVVSPFLGINFIIKF